MGSGFRQRIKRRWPLGVALALVCCWGSGSAAAADLFATQALQRHLTSGRLSPVVKERLDRDGRAEVLVVLADDDVQAEAVRLRQQLKSGQDTEEIVRERGRLLKGKKERLLAGVSPLDREVLREFDHFPVLHLRVNGSALALLLEAPEVLVVHENRAHSHFLSQSLPLIGAPTVQGQGVTGSGTAVAVIDTGVDYTRSAFGSCTAPGTPAGCKVVYVHDFPPDDGQRDDDGHGSNVAGIVLGVAPDTRIAALDVFTWYNDGQGLQFGAFDADILAALEWVLANRASYNIVATNMSLGGGKYSASCSSDPLAGAISSLRDAGVASAIASGNDAYNGFISSPACVPTAISVGAVYDSDIGPISWTAPCTDTSTAADQVTCFTNMANFLTILAPGAWITAAGSTYAGTSQATPHVAGGVALLKGAHPLLTVNDVISQLSVTGIPITTRRQSKTYSKPRLDLAAALRYPKASVAPAGIDFGVVAVGGSSALQNVTVTNAGSADLVLGTLALGGPSAGEFAIQNDLCSGHTLAAAVSCTAGVRLIPLTGGDKSATLTIPGNDPDSPQAFVSLSGTDLVRFPLTVSRSGSGGGTVTSQPAGIDCGAVCSAQFIQATVVTLTPTPAADSFFAGWGGACGGSGLCQPTMAAATAVSATFTLLPPVRLSWPTPGYFTTLGQAYASALDGDTIQAKAAAIAESLIFDREIAVTLRGGYDGAYAMASGYTSVTGDLTIGGGTVVVENLVLQ